MDPFVFLHPGLYNSGPQHWQTHWENQYGFTRIQQRDWETPVCEEWISTLDQTIAPYPAEQVILVGHSLACCTVIKWAEQYGRIVKGALLVGPSDTEAPDYPTGTTGFTPMPLFRPPFPVTVICSSNDEYVSLERAAFFAEQWGAQLVNIGPYGHINSSSNLGLWPEGYTHLRKLML